MITVYGIETHVFPLWESENSGWNDMITVYGIDTNPNPPHWLTLNMLERSDYRLRYIKTSGRFSVVKIAASTKEESVFCFPLFLFPVKTAAFFPYNIS